MISKLFILKRSYTTFIPFALWIVVIFVLLVMPSSEVNKVNVRIPHADKLVHAFIFGVMVLLFGWAYRKEPFSKNALKIFVVTIITCIYGILMEFVQKYALTKPRSYDEWDMVADSIGAFAGFFIIRKVIMYFNEREISKREKFA